jgi:hypothetical protein
VTKLFGYIFTIVVCLCCSFIIVEIGTTEINLNEYSWKRDQQSGFMERHFPEIKQTIDETQETPIHVKYPNQLEGIEWLRSKKGYNDDQIELFFQKLAQKQRLEGYSNHEIATFFGVSSTELAILLYENKSVSPLKFFEVATPDAWKQNSLKYAFYRIAELNDRNRTAFFSLLLLIIIAFANLFALRKGYPISESVTFLFFKRKRAMEIYKISQISQVIQNQEETGNTKKSKLDEKVLEMDNIKKKIQENDEPKRKHFGKDLEKIRFFSKDWFFALWNGERPSWEAWWVLGIFSFAVFSVLVIGSAIVSFQSPPLYPMLEVVSLGVIILVQVFWWVSMWRCSPNVHSKFWHYFTRFIVIGSIAANLQYLISTF